MFAYCNNNPIMLGDPRGEFPWLIVIIIGGCTVIGGILGACADEELGATATEHDIDISSDLISANDVSKNDEQPKEANTLSTGTRIKNAYLGAAMGLAVGGAIVATAGAGGAVAAGSASAKMAAFGLTAKQVFAWGAIAYDSVAMVVAPLLGVEMETIEYEP